MHRPYRYDKARHQYNLQCYLFGRPKGDLRGAHVETIDIFMPVFESESTTESRVAPDFSLPYFAIDDSETRLSLKSPGGPPGSLGKNIPTLR